MQPQRTQSPFQSRALTYDAGLRAFFQKVYNIMAGGLVVTGAVAYGVAQSPQLLHAIFGNQITAMIVMFAPLAFIFLGFTPGRMQRMSSSALTLMFFAFSGVLGLSLTSIFLAYSHESIARAFFIAAAMFGGMSVFGYTTKKDLTGMGSLMIMGMWGVFIAMIVNMFVHSSAIQFATSVIGVLVYTGLVGWQTQSLKQTYAEGAGREANAKLAVVGALGLYLDFINIFMFLLRLTGGNGRR